ncbi:MAG: hypothetical protein JW727_03445 [Candidatus Aenigmarchaeota archaeon]|nr:hypothetical protein [Candidatus Aenigmarchaeota archaeon]
MGFSRSKDQAGNEVLIYGESSIYSIPLWSTSERGEGEIKGYLPTSAFWGRRVDKELGTVVGLGLIKRPPGESREITFCKGVPVGVDLGGGKVVPLNRPYATARGMELLVKMLQHDSINRDFGSRWVDPDYPSNIPWYAANETFPKFDSDGKYSLDFQHWLNDRIWGTRTFGRDALEKSLDAKPKIMAQALDDLYASGAFVDPCEILTGIERGGIEQPKLEEVVRPKGSKRSGVDGFLLPYCTAIIPYGVTLPDSGETIRYVPKPNFPKSYRLARKKTPHQDSSQEDWEEF